MEVVKLQFRENILLINISNNEINRKTIKFYYKNLKEKINIAPKIIFDNLKKELIKFKYIEKNNMVGRIQLSKFNLSNKLVQKVVLTNERFVHIYNRHPEVVNHIKNLSIILTVPDRVLIEKNENVIWFIKKIGNNIKVTLKLNTSNKVNNKENSIIQMQFMRDKEIARMIKKERVKEVYCKDQTIYVSTKKS